jgi:uncharacterized protein (TIGR01777 family)
MSERVLSRTQWVPRPLEEVFAFFQRPENLKRLTPTDLGFEITTTPPVSMKAGAIIDYVVRPFGVPLHWRTLIETYDPPRSFTDLQLKGPYALWRHTHRFEAERGGTRMTDEVRYRLPGGPLGGLAAPLVKRELERIFDYREREVSLLFPDQTGRTIKVVIAGGGGFLGKRLTRELRRRGDRATVLSRSALDGAVRWDGRGGGAWEEELEGADAVVNLCGAGVADRPWTRARRKELEDSRFLSTRALVEAIGRRSRKPRVLVNASAVGWYGDRGEESLREDAAPGYGFLADLCARWEAEARRAEAHGVRTVLLRIGVALGADGGALQRMLLPFKLGLGGRLGGGAQWMPWVHADDVVGLTLASIENDRFRGPVNAVAPEAIRSVEFTRELGRALNRPTPFPVPAAVLRLALGDMSQILLASQRVAPAAALAAGYSFRHPRLDEALRSIVSG